MEESLGELYVLGPKAKTEFFKKVFFALPETERLYFEDLAAAEEIRYIKN
jgi:hypothetical protein